MIKLVSLFTELCLENDFRAQILKAAQKEHI